MSYGSREAPTGRQHSFAPQKAEHQHYFGRWVGSIQRWQYGYRCGGFASALTLRANQMTERLQGNKAIAQDLDDRQQRHGQ
jgi:hypothetical protein